MLLRQSREFMGAAGFPLRTPLPFQRPAVAANQLGSGVGLKVSEFVSPSPCRVPFKTARGGSPLEGKLRESGAGAGLREHPARTSEARTVPYPQNRSMLNRFRNLKTAY